MTRKKNILLAGLFLGVFFTASAMDKQVRVEMVGGKIVGCTVRKGYLKGPSEEIVIVKDPVSKVVKINKTFCFVDGLKFHYVDCPDDSGIEAEFLKKKIEEFEMAQKEKENKGEKEKKLDLE